MERLERIRRLQNEKHLNLNLRTDLRSGDLVLATHDLVVGYESDTPLFTCPDLEIRRGDRVALIGPNGTGKTTFVKSILKEVEPLSGRVRLGAAVEIGYFAQAHAGLNLNHSALDEVLSVSEGIEPSIGQARNYLGRFLFSGDDVFKPIKALSGGERARVALAKLTLRGANFLVLDEPTNHLDIPSQEILQAVLSDFAGTILLVSHDRYFVDALATQVWALEDGNLYVSKGDATLRPYSAYLADRQARQLANAEQATSAANGRALGRGRRSGAPEKREQGRRQQALAEKAAELELAIEAAEARLAALAAELEEASHAQAIEQLQNLGREYRAIEEELAQLLDEWTAMEAA